VVHNGIVENYHELRGELSRQGVVFQSDTDTEVIVHLIARFAAEGRAAREAIRLACDRLHGSQAIVVVSAGEPDRLIAVRIGNAGGLTIGLGEGESFLASDTLAVLAYTRNVVFLESRQLAVLTRNCVEIESLSGIRVEPSLHTVAWDPVSAGRGEYSHYMEKEIHEQGGVLTDTLRDRIDFETGRVQFANLSLTVEEARGLTRMVTVACGSSAYAGHVGKFLIEQLARLPVEVDYGSEFRYRDPVLDGTCAVLAITQSGETVDTLAGMEEARRQGARLWSIVNVDGSQAMRLADGYISMQAGPEIGVASTKAFTASVIDQYLLGLYLGELRGVLGPAELRQHVRDLTQLPDLISQALDRSNEVLALAKKLSPYSNFLYLGRGINYPVALEGALKLKEISYVHAEGYPAGEMKHGPIALIDENMPVVAIVLRDSLYEKMVSQVEQAKARGGIVVAVVSEGDDMLAAKADYILTVPKCSVSLSPVIVAVLLQLFAYFVALERGCDVDKPRHLAKSVTVE
jgi:glucosamine--fructose-6-phosphate aminotransferase (isomerizing)